MSPCPRHARASGASRRGRGCSTRRRRRHRWAHRPTRTTAIATTTRTGSSALCTAPPSPRALSASAWALRLQHRRCGTHRGVLGFRARAGLRRGLPPPAPPGGHRGLRLEAWSRARARGTPDRRRALAHLRGRRAARCPRLAVTASNALIAARCSTSVATSHAPWPVSIVPTPPTSTTIRARRGCGSPVGCRPRGSAGRCGSRCRSMSPPLRSRT